MNFTTIVKFLFIFQIPVVFYQQMNINERENVEVWVWDSLWNFDLLVEQ